MANYFTPGTGGNGSLTVNGQIVPAPMSGAFFPNLASAPMYKGSGQPPPTLPINLGSGGNTSQVSAIAASNPWSPTLSPVIVAILALVIGMAGLRYIHWRG